MRQPLQLGGQLEALAGVPQQIHVARGDGGAFHAHTRRRLIGVQRVGANHREMLGHTLLFKHVEQGHHQGGHAPDEERAVQALLAREGCRQVFEPCLGLLLALGEAGVHRLSLRAARPQAFLRVAHRRAHQVFALRHRLPVHAAPHGAGLELRCSQCFESGARVHVLAPSVVANVLKANGGLFHAKDIKIKLYGKTL